MFEIDENGLVFKLVWFMRVIISVRSSERYILDVSTYILWNQLPWSQHLKIDHYNTSRTPCTPKKFSTFLRAPHDLSSSSHKPPLVVQPLWHHPWRHDTTCHTLIKPRQPLDLTQTGLETNPTPWFDQTCCKNFFIIKVVPFLPRLCNCYYYVSKLKVLSLQSTIV